MIKLFTTLYGSKLYGTSTPTSDRDVKHVVLPNLDDLLIGKPVKNVVKKTNKEQNVRNTADDVDEEFIPVQIFARDFMAGQTYALELAYALPLVSSYKTVYTDIVDDMEVDIGCNPYWKYSVDKSVELWAEQSFHPYFPQFVGELREKFLTSNIKAMMGYVVNQASLYSFKGERLNAVRALQLVIAFADEYYKEDEMTLEQVYAAPIWKERIDAVAAEHPKYVKVTEYDIGDGRFRPCIELLEKKLPFTNTTVHTGKVIAKLEAKYGTRADQASESNVDWKATMHALRIVQEGLQLLDLHTLKLPLDPVWAAHLLSVKRGEIPIEHVKSDIDAGLNELKLLEKTTLLPTSSHEMTVQFEAWLTDWMRKFYQLRY